MEISPTIAGFSGYFQGGIEGGNGFLCPAERLYLIGPAIGSEEKREFHNF